VVRYLLDELPKRLGHPAQFDILCGTSVGAIHACYLAATADQGQGRGARLVDFWTSMRIEEILPLTARDLIRLPRRVIGVRRTVEAMRDGAAPDRLYGLFDTQALERLVLQAIPWRNIRANVRAGRVDAICVAATQIGTARVVIFMETRERRPPQWTRDPNIVPRPTRLLPTHALASAAIPLLFPAVRVASHYYADGGLRLNTPLTPALRLGADRRVEDFGSPLFLFGKVLNALMLDHLDTDLARMHVMNEILSDGVSAFGPNFIERINEVAKRERGQGFRTIHDLVIRPSADLGLLAGQTLQNLSEARSRSPLIRLATRNLGSSERTPESDLLSYLLFDGEFLAPLADLGFADARAREEELVAFFSV
jgi:NTE family protein